MQFVGGLKERAGKGEPVAQFTLGFCYEHGKSVPQDYEKAFDWYMKAAQQGHVNAQYSVGWALRTGTGCSMDEEAAWDWYSKAAAHGHSQAQLTLDSWPSPTPVEAKQLRSVTQQLTDSSSLGSNSSASAGKSFSSNSFVQQLNTVASPASSSSASS